MDQHPYAVAALVLSVAAIGLSITPVLEPDDPETISVSGNAEVSSPPDMVEIVLAVETTDQDAGQAQAQNRNITDAVMTDLTGAGVNESMIETSGYTIQRVEDRDREGTVTATRYRVTNEVTIELHAVERAGAVIDTAVEAGANRVESVTYDLTDPRRQQLQDEALRKAAGVAEEKANSLTERLDVRLGSPVGITESNYDIYRFEADYARGGAGDAVAAPSTVISPGDVEVSASVNVKYRIR